MYLLGGTAAIPDSVATTLTGLGFNVVRYAGTDRYDTALKVATALGGPSTVFLATGTNFPDALSAGPAAAASHGVVLLTDGSTLPAAVKAYLSAHPGTVYAVGGPAVAADPAATPLQGADRYATAAAVATAIFTAPTSVGVASGVTFPDALSGGAYQAQAGGPILLTAPTALATATGTYLTACQDNDHQRRDLRRRRRPVHIRANRDHSRARQLTRRELMSVPTHSLRFPQAVVGVDRWLTA